MEGLDAAFADFLKEVDVGDAGLVSGDAAGEPDSKRPRKERTLKSRAAALRKAAYLNNVAEVEDSLADLTLPDRLLVVDDIDKEEGFAALHLAVIQGSLGVATLLVQRRADVDLPSRDGDTPLMWAARLGSADSCRELLKLGADVGVKNMTRTAASQATAAGHRKVALLLERHAAEVAKAVGLRRRALELEQAAERRRAANAAMVAKAEREAEEKAVEEAYWASIRARRERREAEGGDEDRAAREAYAAAKAKLDAAEREAEEAVSFAVLPAKLRPHYRLLELTGDATEGEVRKAYRKLALRYHPDKNPKDAAAAKEKFTEVAMAYEAVSEYLASDEGKGGGVRVAPPSCY